MQFVYQYQLSSCCLQVKNSREKNSFLNCKMFIIFFVFKVQSKWLKSNLLTGFLRGSVFLLNNSESSIKWWKQCQMLCTGAIIEHYKKTNKGNNELIRPGEIAPCNVCTSQHVAVILALPHWKSKSVQIIV